MTDPTEDAGQGAGSSHTARGQGWGAGCNHTPHGLRARPEPCLMGKQKSSSCAGRWSVRGPSSSPAWLAVQLNPRCGHQPGWVAVSLATLPKCPEIPGVLLGAVQCRPHALPVRLPFRPMDHKQKRVLKGPCRGQLRSECPCLPRQ